MNWRLLTYYGVLAHLGEGIGLSGQFFSVVMKSKLTVLYSIVIMGLKMDRTFFYVSKGARMLHREFTPPDCAWGPLGFFMPVPEALVYDVNRLGIFLIMKGHYVDDVVS